MAEQLPSSVDDLATSLRDHAYLADRGLATVLTCRSCWRKPLLLEGEAGVGKTECAKALAELLRRAPDPAAVLRGHRRRPRALRLELRAPDALHPHAGGGRRTDARETLHELFAREFLVRRPLLDAIEHDDPIPPVLLIDEIDRADDEFEAFLLELLSDFQVTIPEIGTIAAAARPLVILTSNRTRELHDALKRRCLYHWIGHPSLEREIEIVQARVPGVPERLAGEAAAFVGRAARARPGEGAGRRRDDRLDAGAAGPGPGGARRRGRRCHAGLGAEVPRGCRAGARPRTPRARRGASAPTRDEPAATPSSASSSRSAGSSARPASRSGPAGCRTRCAAWTPSS